MLDSVLRIIESPVTGILLSLLLGAIAVGGKFSQAAANFLLFVMWVVGSLSIMRIRLDPRLLAAGVLFLAAFCFVVSYWIQPPKSVAATQTADSGSSSSLPTSKTDTKQKAVSPSQSQQSHGSGNPQQQQQNNSGGTNVQQQSSGNGSPNITQVGPCNVAQVGHDNVATVNCAPPSGTELAKFGAGTVVQIVNDAMGAAPTPIATGFWLSDKGYIATCLHSLNGGSEIGAFVPMPPLLGKQMTVSSGGMTTAVKPIAVDKEADVAIMQVVASPFQRQMHGFAFAQRVDDKGAGVGKPEITQEQYWVPAVASDLAQSGDEVIKVGFAYDHLPVVNYDFGHIKRIGTDSSAQKKSFRFYTSLPFKESDCGAPLINNAKTVIGMLRGSDDSANSVATPVSYVMDLLKSIGN